jgi:hypothetical protein
MADIFMSFIHEDEMVADGVKTFLREKLKIYSEVFLASDKWANDKMPLICAFLVV